MFTQLTPLALQRCHWYWNAVGVFDHVPFCAVSVSPTRALPVIVGGAVFAGGAARAEPTNAIEASTVMIATAPRLVDFQWVFFILPFV